MRSCSRSDAPVVPPMRRAAATSWHPPGAHTGPSSSRRWRAPALVGPPPGPRLRPATATPRCGADRQERCRCATPLARPDWSAPDLRPSHGVKARFGARAIRPGPAPGRGAGSPAAALDSRTSRRSQLRWRGVSPLRGGGPARCLSVGGRTVRAAAAAPFPRTRRQPVPAVTHHQLTTPKPKRPGAVLPAPGDPVAAKAPIRALRPAAFASLRFAPRRPLDSDLPRQEPAPARGRDKIAVPDV
jgi:hypothetical protein